MRSNKHKSWFLNWNRGQAHPLVLFLMAAIAGILAVVIIPLMLAGSSIRASIDRLEDEGYVVMTPAEYQAVITRLEDIRVAALAAVNDAEAAVVAAETAVDLVNMYNSAEVFVFPITSDVTCTLTAGNTNVWSNWTEVADSGAVTLSSKFAINAGYVSDMHFFLPSDVSDGYNIELSYGVAKTTLGRVALYAPASGEISGMIPIKSRRVPAGETVYYRMQSTGANGATIGVRFRYFYE